MPAAGDRLGPYEIVALIGAGGMGEVYRARDTRLNRDVALKVLPELFAADPDRLARFKRESQVLASLNHPNIAAIHGLETSTGVEVLVLELVEGPTLAERIAEGALPVDQALPIAMQIADALDAAHGLGIVHRDLKPANIKVRDDGTVKVLDFGLAKALQEDASAPDVTHSPTLSVAATRMGMILGTAAYMAPEQAKGKSVDKRADIWAFGCVLYEMLTGQMAFPGEDVSEILASVIKGTTNLDLLPAGTHPALRALIARCIEKDVRKRRRDIGDIRYELERIQADPGGTLTHATAGVARAPSRRMLPWVAVAVTLTALVGGAAVWSLKPAPPQESRPVARFSYTLPENQTFRNTGRPVVAMAPDGRHFVLNETDGLYLRSMDGLDANLIQGTEMPLTTPFFSPDGQWVGFFAGDELKKIPVTGGTAVVLCKATNPFGAHWGADNTILFGQPEGIMRVSANGGTAERLIAAEKGTQAHAAQMLPGGEWVLYSVASGIVPNRWDTAEIVAQSLTSGERKVLWRGGSDARYVPTGHLIYALGDALFALPFDLERVQVTGGPVPLLDGLQRATNPAQTTATAQYGVSDGGTLLYVVGASTASELRTLAWFDRSGREEAVPAPPRAYYAPRISPDGTRVALDVRDQENDIWIWSLARSTLTRLTFDPGADRYPAWTPDGQRIAFSSARAGAGAGSLFWQAADGTGVAEQLTTSQTLQFPGSISADGTQLVLEEQGRPSTGTDVLVLALAGERRVMPLVATTFTERSAELSRDGRWVAYESNESGRYEVYVRPFPGVDGGRWQVSTGGGRSPLWAPNSRELFYVDVEGRIVAASIQPGPGFVAGNPKVIVDGPFTTTLTGIAGRLYDVSPDGQRFLMTKAVEGAGQQAPPPQVIVVQNWFEELKRLAPVN